MLLVAQDCNLIHLSSIPYIKWEYHHLLHRNGWRFYSSAFAKHFEIKIKYFSETIIRALLYLIKYLTKHMDSSAKIKRSCSV